MAQENKNENNKKVLELENYLQQYLDLFDKSNIISKTDKTGKITYVNDSFCKISKYDKKELIGKSHNIIRHPDNHKELYKNMWETLKTKKQSWDGVLKNIAKDGSSYYVRTIISPILDIDGNVKEYVSVRDAINTIIDDKKTLFDRIESNFLSVLVLVQIEEFDMFEKFYTSSTVDQLEKQFAFNLLGHLPLSCGFESVYSLGDGKFALLSDLDTYNKGKIDLESYLKIFESNVKKSNLKIDDLDFDLNITISYAIGKYMLYEDAKAGLENAKKSNKRITFANDSSISVSQEAKNNLKMIKTVKVALEKYNVVSYFQPIIENKTKKIAKYESLVRIIDEDGNIISPHEFLNISKKGNYYNEITQRVLENSFKILHQIKTKLSINLSARDIEKEQTRKKIFELLKEYKKDAHRIIFEFLEDENINELEKVITFIKQIKAKGVQIAIDDFGTGYSNFERLMKFEPDILKIDGSLIKDIQNNEYSRTVVETIVSFAKKQNIETIAEFVEDEQTFNVLCKIGVDYSQGYYFGKPQEYCEV